METRFGILRPPWDLWRRNESIGIFASRFWASVTPAQKSRQQLKYQFWYRKVHFQSFTKYSNIYIKSKDFMPRFIILSHYLQTHHRLAENKPQTFELQVYREIFWQLPPNKMGTTGKRIGSASQKWLRELRVLLRNSRLGRKGWMIGQLWSKNSVAGESFNGLLRLGSASTTARISGEASPAAWLAP